MRTTSAIQLGRRNFMAAAVLILLSIVGLRYFQFQILLHNKYSTYAENNSIRAVRLKAPRGIILDRNGEYLVTNRPQFNLAVIPAEVENSLPELELLSRFLEIEPEDISLLIEQSDGVYERFQPVTLYEDVSFTQRSYIEEHRLEFPGIFFMDHSIRHYPSRARATQVIGYLRAIAEEDYEEYRKDGYHMGDVVGSAGVEKLLERHLRGEEGYRYHLVDNMLRDLGEIPDKPTQYPVQGDSLSLSLAVDLQAFAERLMESRIGSLLVMDPNTGEIYAFVSVPDYVLDPFVGPIPQTLWDFWRDHPDKVMLTRPINGLYPPGSTFKVIAAAAALAGGKIDPAATVECNAVYPFGNRVFHCNVWPGHGVVDLQDALRLSCNIYFYKLIQQIGFEAWIDMAKQFGFGAPTGIDLPQESLGLVPTPEYMDNKYADVGWTAGHLLNLVLGQGDLLVTPMQVARMTAAIANGGTLVYPQLVLDPVLRDNHPPKMDLPDRVWSYLQSSMYQVVNGEKGTGFRARVTGARIYGKTGTAQNPHGDGHSWFTGYLVTSDGHKVVVTVLVEMGGLGSRVAAPMAGEVFRYYLEQYPVNREGQIAQID
ncbi:MAG: penicillin-binding protein 2 [Candidatus Neomarinimicrobiota bacterium]